MHVLGDPLVDLDDDAGTATLDTYAVVYQLGDAGAGQGDLTLGIRYLDEAVGTTGRWVLAHRRGLWTVLEPDRTALRPAGAAAAGPGVGAGALAVPDRHLAVDDGGEEADRALLEPAPAGRQVVDQARHGRADASPGRRR